jgi:hypothetical protein
MAQLSPDREDRSRMAARTSGCVTAARLASGSDSRAWTTTRVLVALRESARRGSRGGRELLVLPAHEDDLSARQRCPFLGLGEWQVARGKPGRLTEAGERERDCVH